MVFIMNSTCLVGMGPKVISCCRPQELLSFRQVSKMLVLAFASRSVQQQQNHGRNNSSRSRQKSNCQPGSELNCDKTCSRSQAARLLSQRFMNATPIRSARGKYRTRTNGDIGLL